MLDFYIYLQIWFLCGTAQAMFPDHLGIHISWRQENLSWFGISVNMAIYISAQILMAIPWTHWVKTMCGFILCHILMGGGKKLTMLAAEA